MQVNNFVPQLPSQFSSLANYFDSLKQLVLVEAIDLVRDTVQKGLHILHISGGGSAGDIGRTPAITRRGPPRHRRAESGVFRFSLEAHRLLDSSVIPPAPRATRTTAATRSAVTRVRLTKRQRLAAARNANLTAAAAVSAAVHRGVPPPQCCHVSFKFKAKSVARLRRFVDSQRDGISPASPGFAFLIQRGSSASSASSTSSTGLSSSSNRSASTRADTADAAAPASLDSGGGWFLALVGGHYTDLPTIEVDAFVRAPTATQPFMTGDVWRVMPLCSLLPLQVCSSSDTIG